MKQTFLEQLPKAAHPPNWPFERWTTQSAVGLGKRHWQYPRIERAEKPAATPLRPWLLSTVSWALARLE